MRKVPNAGILIGVTLEPASLLLTHANLNQTYWPTSHFQHLTSTAAPFLHLFHSVTITNFPLISLVFPFTLFLSKVLPFFTPSHNPSLLSLSVCWRPPVGMCEMRISRRTLPVLLSSKKNPDRRKQGENAPFRLSPSLSLSIRYNLDPPHLLRPPYFTYLTVSPRL